MRGASLSPPVSPGPTPRGVPGRSPRSGTGWGRGLRRVVCRPKASRATTGSARLSDTLAPHQYPAVASQSLLRQETGFVGHLRRAADPISEIDISQAHALGSLNVVEDHIGAEPAVPLVG